MIIQVGGGSYIRNNKKSSSYNPKNMSVIFRKMRLAIPHIVRIYDNKYILDVRTIFEEFEIIANELKKVLN